MRTEVGGTLRPTEEVLGKYLAIRGNLLGFLLSSHIKKMKAQGLR